MTFDDLLNLVSSSQAPPICVDSRKVKAGDVFVAVKGTVYDGHDFIDQALDNGAKYIVCRKDNSSFEMRDSCIEVITVDDSATAAAILAQKSRANPAAKLTNLAVTGTNGKTTVAYLVRSVIQTAGEKCGLIGTIIYDTGSGDACEAALTTPDPLLVAEIQQQMVKAGSKYMVIEASSHALSQNRLAGIQFKAAAFTNLAGDHLDYHKTKQEYLAAKTRLFTGLSENATAVLNRQSPEAEFIAEQTNARLLLYAIDAQADIIAYIEKMDMDGTTFVLEYAGQKQRINTPLLGQHNVSNHLAAAGLCLTVGFDLKIIAAGLSNLKAIPGRLEKVDYAARDSSVSSHVFIDYAHTDDALKNVLTTLKPLCKGRLIAVFGCGGDRDRTKRPRMASVAEKLADLVIVTSDNPRTERPEDIIDEIVSGFDSRESCIVNRESSHESRVTNHKIVIEPDRRKAIELAIEKSARDDIVLIAGKGHETYQIIGTQRLDFSDKAVAQNQLQKIKCENPQLKHSSR